MDPSRRAAALCLCAASALIGGCLAKALTPLPTDSDYVLSIEDIAEYMGTSDYPLEFGMLKKRRTPMGAYELSYEYDSEDPPLYLYWELTVHRNLPRAREYYGSGGVGFWLGAKLVSGVSFVRDDDFVVWGDASSFYAIEAEGEPVGSAFWARSGRRTLLLMTAGIYFDTRESFDELVRPRLTNALRFEPEATPD